MTKLNKTEKTEKNIRTKKGKEDEEQIKYKDLYLSFFNNNHAVMLLIDPKTRSIVNANIAASDFYGYSHEKLVSMKISDINVLPPKELKEEIKRAISTPRKYFRFQHRLASGDIRDVEAYSGPVSVGDRKLLFSVIHDITERVRVEEALHQSERRMRLHVEGTPLAVIEWDSEFKIVRWNNAAEKIFGYSADEAIGCHGSMIVHRDDWDYVKQVFENVLKRGLGNITNRNVRKDGKEIYCEWHSTPLTTSDGILIGVTSMAQDITERRNTEVTLSKFLVAVEQNPSSIVITGRDGNIEYVNPKFTQMTGYTAEEAIGKNPRILKSGKTTQEEYRILWDTLLSGREWRGRFFNRKKNGELFWEEAIIAPIQDNTGSITSFIAIKEDITERKKMEETLQRSEELYRFLADNSNDIIWTSDAKNRLTYVSASVEHLLGYTVEEVMQLGQEDMYTPASLEVVRAVFKTVSDEAKAGRKIKGSHVELEYICKGGSTRWVEVSYSGIYDNSSRFTGLHGVSRDISERKKAEASLEKYHTFLENLSLTDGLTGVGNRRRFDDTLEREWRRAMRNQKPISSILMDIDFFKDYNDHYGHLAGDDCLRMVAQRIAEIVKRPTDLVARYGGEEFVCLMPDTDAGGALWVARQIQSGMETLDIPFAHSRVSDHVTLSMGIGTFVPVSGQSSSDLLKVADRNLYTAKNTGRNKMVNDSLDMPQEGKGGPP